MACLHGETYDAPMGWWMIAPALMVIPVGLIWWEKRHPNPDAAYQCPQCEHQVGLDDALSHCAAVDDLGGWVSSDCYCDNDYHWNYEATVDTAT
jgi:hypothetical protein